MHDIGKLIVPNQLLNKPGLPHRVGVRACPTPRSRLRRAAAAASTSSPPSQATPPPRRPTAAVDGTGLIEPAIIHVADAFDAMTSTTRSYRRALSQETAFGELRAGAGTQFNAECVEALISAIELRGEHYGDGHEVDGARVGDGPARSGHRIGRARRRVAGSSGERVRQPGRRGSRRPNREALDAARGAVGRWRRRRAGRRARRTRAPPGPRSPSSVARSRPASSSSCGRRFAPRSRSPSRYMVVLARQRVDCRRRPGAARRTA